MVTEKLRLFGALTLSALVAACGGNSSEEDLLTGVFSDSPVGGLNYVTPTASGVTDAEGRFSYRDGETIVFSVGNLALPVVVASEMVTPLDMAAEDDVSNQVVVNIARLLQSLDADGNPENGIVIPASAAEAFPDTDIYDVTDNSAVEVVVDQIYGDERQAVTAENAMSHFVNSLSLNAGSDASLEQLNYIVPASETFSGDSLYVDQNNFSLSVDGEVIDGTVSIIEGVYQLSGIQDTWFVSVSDADDNKLACLNKSPTSTGNCKEGLYHVFAEESRAMAFNVVGESELAASNTDQEPDTGAATDVDEQAAAPVEQATTPIEQPATPVPSGESEIVLEELFPLCDASVVDDNGDGYGWQNNETCLIVVDGTIVADGSRTSNSAASSQAVEAPEEVPVSVAPVATPDSASVVVPVALSEPQPEAAPESETASEPEAALEPEAAAEASEPEATLGASEPVAAAEASEPEATLGASEPEATSGASESEATSEASPVPDAIEEPIPEAEVSQVPQPAEQPPESASDPDPAWDAAPEQEPDPALVTITPSSQPDPTPPVEEGMQAPAETPVEQPDAETNSENVQAPSSPTDAEANAGTAPEGTQASAITDIIVLTGQSNAASVQTSFDALLDSGHERLFAFDTTGEWQLADLDQYWDSNLPSNYASAEAGREPFNNLAFQVGKSLAEQSERVVGVILITAPGEGISHWDYNSEFYVKIRNRVSAALSKLPQKDSVDAMIWMQGETDWLAEGTADPGATGFASTDSDFYRNYYPNKLDQLINNLRSEWWFGPQAQFICGETKKTDLNHHLMALNTDGDDFTSCAQASDLPTRTSDPFGNHYSAEGLRTLGGRMAELYLSGSD